MDIIPRQLSLSLFDEDTCTRCGETKLNDQFIKSKKPRWCKACKRASDRDYYERNAEKVKAQAKVYAEANAEKIQAYNRSEERKAKNREREQDPKRKAERKAYYASEAGRAMLKKAWAKNHAKRSEDEAFKEAARIRAKAWAEANPERRQEYNRSESRKATYKLNNSRRRAAGTLTRAEWTAILEAYEYDCAYCGTSDCPMQIEHVIPVSKGGLTVKDNIVPACEPCNKRKQADLWTPRPPTRPQE